MGNENLEKLVNSAIDNKAYNVEDSFEKIISQKIVDKLKDRKEELEKEN